MSLIQRIHEWSSITPWNVLIRHAAKRDWYAQCAMDARAAHRRCEGKCDCEVAFKSYTRHKIKYRRLVKQRMAELEAMRNEVIATLPDLADRFPVDIDPRYCAQQMTGLLAMAMKRIPEVVKEDQYGDIRKKLSERRPSDQKTYIERLLDGKSGEEVLKDIKSDPKALRRRAIAFFSSVNFPLTIRNENEPYLVCTDPHVKEAPLAPP